jgi:hypothetical protein
MKRRAVAEPRPPAAPVTTTIFPFNPFIQLSRCAPR